MSFGLNERNRSALIEVFGAFPSVERVLIFGSRARGDFRDGSDFDLAVFAPHMSDPEFTRLWDAVESLDFVFKIDLLHFDRLTNRTLRERILAEGRPFFEESSKAI